MDSLINTLIIAIWQIEALPGGSSTLPPPPATELSTFAQTLWLPRLRLKPEHRK